jgi:hypothetical protein
VNSSARFNPAGFFVNHLERQLSPQMVNSSATFHPASFLVNHLVKATVCRLSNQKVLSSATFHPASFFVNHLVRQLSPQQSEGEQQRHISSCQLFCEPLG